jgi:hypothetical protein
VESSHNDMQSLPEPVPIGPWYSERWLYMEVLDEAWGKNFVSYRGGKIVGELKGRWIKSENSGRVPHQSTAYEYCIRVLHQHAA